MDATLNWLAEQVPEIEKRIEATAWFAMLCFEPKGWEAGYMYWTEFLDGDEWALRVTADTPGSAIYQLKEQVKEFLKDG